MTHTVQTADNVQSFLDHLHPMQLFYVVFLKSDGTERELVGALDPAGDTRKENVPVMTEQGWRSFNINRVIEMGLV